MILGTFFQLGTGDMDIAIGYMGDLFSDLSPYLIVIIGVGIALIVVEAIISAIRR